MPNDLRRLFEQTLKLSLATPLIYSCGVGGIDTREFEEVCSGENTGALNIANLKPANAVDYAELRSIFMYGGQNDPATESVASAFGTKCANSSSTQACESALASLKAMEGFGKKCDQVCSALYLATQRADVVSSINTLEALKGFLGTIDTEQEAVLLVKSQHLLNFVCNDKSRGAIRKTGTGYEVIGYEGYACGEGTAVTQHVIAVNADGSTTELSTAVLERGKAGCAIGRRPCGLNVAYGRIEKNPLARHFVAAAHLEAASVPAFLRFGAELRAHGAPLQFTLAARLSARDEVKHARAVSALARRFGGRPVSPRVSAMPLRPLMEVVRDNAVEGCVRETFGALVAHRQAQKAKDAGIRSELSRIAQDETRHAALSWEVHEWAQTRLSRMERRELREAQRAAVQQLREESAAPVEAELVEQAGMPDADEAVTLVGELEQTLWS